MPIKDIKGDYSGQGFIGPIEPLPASQSAYMNRTIQKIRNNMSDSLKSLSTLLEKIGNALKGRGFATHAQKTGIVLSGLLKEFADNRTIEILDEVDVISKEIDSIKKNNSTLPITDCSDITKWITRMKELLNKFDPNLKDRISHTKIENRSESEKRFVAIIEGLTSIQKKLLNVNKSVKSLPKKTQNWKKGISPAANKPSQVPTTAKRLLAPKKSDTIHRFPEKNDASKTPFGESQVKKETRVGVTVPTLKAESRKSEPKVKPDVRQAEKVKEPETPKTVVTFPGAGQQPTAQVTERPSVVKPTAKKETEKLTQEKEIAKKPDVFNLPLEVWSVSTDLAEPASHPGFKSTLEWRRVEKEEPKTKEVGRAPSIVSRAPSEKSTKEKIKGSVKSLLAAFNKHYPNNQIQQNSEFLDAEGNIEDNPKKVLEIVKKQLLDSDEDIDDINENIIKGISELEVALGEPSSAELVDKCEDLLDSVSDIISNTKELEDINDDIISFQNKEKIEKGIRSLVKGIEAELGDELSNEKNKKLDDYRALKEELEMMLKTKFKSQASEVPKKTVKTMPKVSQEVSKDASVEIAKNRVSESTRPSQVELARLEKEKEINSKINDLITAFYHHYKDNLNWIALTQEETLELGDLRQNTADTVGNANRTIEIIKKQLQESPEKYDALNKEILDGITLLEKALGVPTSQELVEMAGKLLEHAEDSIAENQGLNAMEEDITMILPKDELVRDIRSLIEGIKAEFRKGIPETSAYRSTKAKLEDMLQKAQSEIETTAKEVPSSIQKEAHKVTEKPATLTVKEQQNEPAVTSLTAEPMRTGLAASKPIRSEVPLHAIPSHEPSQQEKEIFFSLQGLYEALHKHYEIHRGKNDDVMRDLLHIARGQAMGDLKTNARKAISIVKEIIDSSLRAGISVDEISKALFSWILRLEEALREPNSEADRRVGNREDEEPISIDEIRSVLSDDFTELLEEVRQERSSASGVSTLSDDVGGQDVLKKLLDIPLQIRNPRDKEDFRKTYDQIKEGINTIKSIFLKPATMWSRGNRTLPKSVKDKIGEIESFFTEATGLPTPTVIADTAQRLYDAAYAVKNDNDKPHLLQTLGSRKKKELLKAKQELDSGRVHNDKELLETVKSLIKVIEDGFAIAPSPRIGRFVGPEYGEYQEILKELEELLKPQEEITTEAEGPEAVAKLEAAEELELLIGDEAEARLIGKRKNKIKEELESLKGAMAGNKAKIEKLLPKANEKDHIRSVLSENFRELLEDVTKERPYLDGSGAFRFSDHVEGQEAFEKLLNIPLKISNPQEKEGFREVYQQIRAGIDTIKSVFLKSATKDEREEHTEIPDSVKEKIAKIDRLLTETTGLPTPTVVSDTAKQLYDAAYAVKNDKGQSHLLQALEDPPHLLQGRLGHNKSMESTKNKALSQAKQGLDWAHNDAELLKTVKSMIEDIEKGFTITPRDYVWNLGNEENLPEINDSEGNEYQKYGDILKKLEEMLDRMSSIESGEPAGRSSSENPDFLLVRDSGREDGVKDAGRGLAKGERATRKRERALRKFEKEMAGHKPSGKYAEEPTPLKPKRLKPKHRDFDLEFGKPSEVVHADLDKATRSFKTAYALETLVTQIKQKFGRENIEESQWFKDYQKLGNNPTIEDMVPIAKEALQFYSDESRSDNFEVVVNLENLLKTELERQGYFKYNKLDSIERLRKNLIDHYYKHYQDHADMIRLSPDEQRALVELASKNERTNPIKNANGIIDLIKKQVKDSPETEGQIPTDITYGISNLERALGPASWDISQEAVELLQIATKLIGKNVKLEQMEEDIYWLNPKEQIVSSVRALIKAIDSEIEKGTNHYSDDDLEEYSAVKEDLISKLQEF